MIQNLEYLVDIIVVGITIYSAIQVNRAALGGVVGSSLNMILWGSIILAGNHLLNGDYLTNFFNSIGLSLLQAPIVYKGINLIGFLFMAAGYSRLGKVQNGNG